jgi:hypothetical protein
MITIAARRAATSGAQGPLLRHCTGLQTDNEPGVATSHWVAHACQEVGEYFFQDPHVEASLRLSPRSPSLRRAGRSMTSTRRRVSPRSRWRCAGTPRARPGTRASFFSFRPRFGFDGAVETYIASSGRVRGTNASGPSRSSARLMSISVSMQGELEQGARQEETHEARSPCLLVRGRSSFPWGDRCTHIADISTPVGMSAACSPLRRRLRPGRPGNRGGRSEVELAAERFGE